MTKTRTSIVLKHPSATSHLEKIVLRPLLFLTEKAQVSGRLLQLEFEATRSEVTNFPAKETVVSNYTSTAIGYFKIFCGPLTK